MATGGFVPRTPKSGGQRSEVVGVMSSSCKSKPQPKEEREMVRTNGSIRQAAPRQQGDGPDPVQDSQVVPAEMREQVGPDENLIEQAPEVGDVFGAPVIIRA